jgi:hypothetical protein
MSVDWAELTVPRARRRVQLPETLNSKKKHTSRQCCSCRQGCACRQQGSGCTMVNDEVANQQQHRLQKKTLGFATAVPASFFGCRRNFSSQRYKPRRPFSCRGGHWPVSTSTGASAKILRTLLWFSDLIRLAGQAGERCENQVLDSRP